MMVPMKRLLFLNILLLVAVGCKRPPDAPNTLDDLASYLYEHVMDDEEFLVAGIDNLETWLAQDNEAEEFETNLDSTAEGYTVTNLSDEAVVSLDGVERDLNNLLGAAVGYDIDLEVEQVIGALIGRDMMEVFPGNYQSYERTFESEDDPACFLDGDCDAIQFLIQVVADYPLNLTVDAESVVQYRRVELDDGRKAVVQRTWMSKPGEASVDWIQLEQQYFLAVHLPQDSGMRRVETMWVKASLGSAPVPEDMALSLAVDTMRTTGQDLEAYFESL